MFSHSQIEVSSGHGGGQGRYDSGTKEFTSKEILNDHYNVVQPLRLLPFPPLAIVQAAAYVNENGISLAGHLSLLDNRECLDSLCRFLIRT